MVFRRCICITDMSFTFKNLVLLFFLALQLLMISYFTKHNSLIQLYHSNDFIEKFYIIKYNENTNQINKI